MSKNYKVYELRDHPEHQEALDANNRRWIQNAFSTEPMTERDREICRSAVRDLYRGAGIEPPPPHRIVFVSSPFVMQFAGGFASAIWEGRKKSTPRTYAATYDATHAATHAADAAARTVDDPHAPSRSVANTLTRDVTDATYAATLAAAGNVTHTLVHNFPYSGTADPTWDAADAATRAAHDFIDAFTYDAIHNATHNATWHATYDGGRAVAIAVADTATHAAAHDVADYDTTIGAAYAATMGAAVDTVDASAYNATDYSTRAAISVPDDIVTAATHDATREATNVAFADAEAITDTAAHYAPFDATHNGANAPIDAATACASPIVNYVDSSIFNATFNAVDIATYAATHTATQSFSHDPTRDATRDATREAANVATPDAPGDDNWWKFPVHAMRKLADKLGVSEFGLKCAQNAYRMCQGGNQWSWTCSLISFGRDIAKLGESHGIDYSQYECWEQLALHSGPRIVHEKFCIISDRPRALHVDSQNRPHCGTGPFCEWRDGSALYALNGVRIPAWLVLTPPEKLKASRIMALENAQQRAEGIKKKGIGSMLSDLNAETIDRYESYELVTIQFEGVRIGPYLKMVNPSTGEIHVEGVGTPNGRVDETIKTCQQALAWRNGMDRFIAPETLT